MSSSTLKDTDIVECWRCDTELEVFTIRTFDGFCPVCDVEIDLDQEPYTNDEET